MAVAATLGPGLGNAAIAMIVVWWPLYARLMRAQVLEIREREHVEAAVAGGAGPFRVLFVHVASLAEFERELIRERTIAGLVAARARGRSGGRRFALTKSQVRFAQAAMTNRETSVSELCKELGIKPVTLYRYVGPNGEIRENGSRVLAA